MSLSVFILSFLPGILWLIWFQRFDRRAPEPKRLVAYVFFLGMVMTFPSALANMTLGYFAPGPAGSVTHSLFIFFLVVGPVEETFKLLAVLLGIYRHREFDEPIDALVYSSAAALGFASLENVLYAWQFGGRVLIVRALMAVPGHLLFSAIWGYGLAQAKFNRRKGVVLPTLALAALVHGVYDFALVVGQLASLVFVIPLLVVMIAVLLRFVRNLRSMAPVGQEPVLEPAAAASRDSYPAAERRGSYPAAAESLGSYPTVTESMSSSGEIPSPPPPVKEPWRQLAGTLYCGACGTAVLAEDRYCGNCGRPLSEV